MSQPASNCPNCGAPVKFRWSGAAQTTCEFCNSILVRTDIDLKKVGEVADLPPDSSPLQIGVEGIYNNKAFTIVGRIIYDWEQGSWNEWHLVFNDGSSGWLADAQLEYDVSFLANPGQPLPSAESIAPDASFTWAGTEYRATVKTLAHYRGVEGELPFQYWGKDEIPFVDLRSQSGKFATIDYSENPPLLFLGEAVEFDSLKMKNLREFEGWP
jgi:hypothetical protein